jgi:hypothetical protein
MRSTTLPIRLFPVLLAFAVVPAALRAQERYSLSGDVAIFNLAGEVTLEAGNAAGTVVDVTRGGRDAGQLDIATSEIRGWQTIRIRYPDDRIVYRRDGWRGNTQFSVREDGTFGGRFGDGDSRSTLGALLEAIGIGGDGNRVRISSSGSGLEAWADLRIQVPAGRTVTVYLGVGRITATNIDGELFLDSRSGGVETRGTRGTLVIDTGSGSAEVENARGDVDVDTGSGSIRARDISGGNLRLDTGSGRITASSLDVSDLEVDTGSGTIEIDGVRTPRLEAETGSGSIRVRAASVDELSLDTGSGSVTVSLESAVRDVLIDTGSGSVTLEVPPDLNASLDLDTGSGGITVDLPIRVIEKKRNYLRAALGDGGGRIRVDTGSGGIRIRPVR